MNTQHKYHLTFNGYISPQIYSVTALLIVGLQEPGVSIVTNAYLNCLATSHGNCSYFSESWDNISKLEAQNNHAWAIGLLEFSGLTQLIILNLSYTHLNYILPATSEDTPQLFFHSPHNDVS
jgi:hypothetical protein